MRVLLTSTLALATMLAALPAYAQSTDTAAERARLANERIQLEAQRRAEEERRRQQREAAESEAGGSEAAGSEAGGSETIEPDAPAHTADSAAGRAERSGSRAAPAASRSADSPRAASLPPAGDDRISRTLEQLRELGELRDAGYVTDEEFERIKTRILNSRF